MEIVKLALGRWLPGGWMADRIGRGAAIIVGWVIYAFVYIAMPFASNFGTVCALLLFYGVYYGMTEGAERAGEIGTLERFSSEASLALYLGMCPLDNQSGQFHGTKTPRQVNRRAKAAIMAAVARHIDHVPQSKAYYDRKRSEGKKHNQAVRALGRHLVRVMWSMIKQGRNCELREPRRPT